MGANPHANGGLLLRDLELPDFRDYAVEVPAPGASVERGRRACSATFLRDVIERNPDRFRIDGPGRDRLEPARRRVRGDRPHLGGRARRRATTTSRRTAA